MLALLWIQANAQTDSNRNQLSISGYIETYYAYDFGSPANHNRPVFMYSHNRHNEVNLNLGFAKLAYQNTRVRGNLAFMAGTYANANLAAEPGVIKNIFEANVGIKVAATHNIWIDAGIFPSHIGFESAIGKDCWNLTRSILADNSPYYESGIKLGYTSHNEKWYVSALLLNGWQRIQRVPGNNTPAFGHQLTFKPSEGITLNSSSFIGSDTPDSVRQMRYFHNLYGQFTLTRQLDILVGFDMGVQQKAQKSKQYNSWYAPVIIARYRPAEKIRIAARAEFYADGNGVIIQTGTPNGFQTFGCSMNMDYHIVQNVVWRIEGRSFFSDDKIFTVKDKPVNHNYSLTTALAISL
jgi:hypothetical protein